MQQLEKGTALGEAAPSRTQGLARGAWADFNWKMIFRTQDLGGRCAHYHWGIVTSRPPQKTRQGNTLACARTHNYIYFCVCLSGYIFKKQESILLPPIPIQNPRIVLLASPLALFLTSFSDSKLPFFICNIFIYLLNPSEDI